MNTNTEIVPLGIEKFTLPDPPVFTGNGPLWSTLSLLGFCVASLVALFCTPELPMLARAPFLFTALGSAVGFVYELWLIASGRPYQLFVSAGGRTVQAVRALIFVFVFASTYLAYALITFGHSSITLCMVATVGGLAGLLFVVLLFQGPRNLAALGHVDCLQVQIGMLRSKADLYSQINTS